jgi:hypothetical protein
MAVIGSTWICKKCGIVFMLIGNTKHIVMNPIHCCQKGCDGEVEKATIGWQ